MSVNIELTIDDIRDMDPASVLNIHQKLLERADDLEARVRAVLAELNRDRDERDAAVYRERLLQEKLDARNEALARVMTRLVEDGLANLIELREDL